MPFSNYWRPERTNVVPFVKELLPRARKPQPRKEYHVQIAGCTEIAGQPVKDKKIKLTAAQAKYWIDQGLLGEQAGEHKPGALLEKKVEQKKK